MRFAETAEEAREEKAHAELDRLARLIGKAQARETEAVAERNGAFAVQIARRRIALQERYDVLRAQLVSGALV